MTNIETQELEHEQGIVQPGEPIAQEAPQAQLPASAGEVEREKRLFDRASGIEASIGGLRIVNMAEVMDVAKMMSMSGSAVPAHCRTNVGMCFAICLQAMEWKMSPFAVANKSYVTNDRLNYESQLVHAVIEARAPLRERLRVRYEGDGDERICVVSGWFKGEAAPREHRSSPLKDARPPIAPSRKTGEMVRKGSPLWDKKPDVQMFYDTSRDFCRIYCPDVLMGIYTPDEVEQYDIGAEGLRDVTAEADAAAALHQRLSATPKNGEGFREGVVEAGLQEVAGKPKEEGAATPTAAKAKKPTGGHAPAATRVSKALAETGKGDKAGPKITNAKDYEAHLKGWLAVMDDPYEVSARWGSEFKLRKACGVGGGEAGTQMVKLKDARLKELKK